LNEDIKIDSDFSYLGELTEGDLDDTGMSEKFILDESKRESWQDKSDTRSAYASIPKQVRKVLGRI